MPRMLRVTLIRSLIRSTASQRGAVRGLGLRKIRQSRIVADSPEARGMIEKVHHLVETAEVD
jgi:large subunit ribosomal protein L30